MWCRLLLPYAVALTLVGALPRGSWGVPRAGQEGAPSPPATEASEEPAAPESASEEPAAEPDEDADLPVLLVFEADAPSYVYVDGELKGRVEPEEPLEVRVELGEIEIRATAIDARGAAWEKTIELEEPGEQTVRIRMNRAIRLWRREERETGVFRDPKTRLMWPMRDNGYDVDLRRAYAYCSSLKTGGFEDWRLPLLDELRSLESIWQRGTYKIRGEILLTECCIWSSEYDGSARARTFNFRFRKDFDTNAGYALGFRALCVRPWPETEPGDETDSESKAEERASGDRR